MNLSSWGMYPKIDHKVYPLEDERKLKTCLARVADYIPFGNGRSYGDSALSQNIIYCKPNNCFLGFDEINGVLHLQSGVLLAEVLEVIIPKGWFLKVTPGTKFITIGGAIASDVHGKNHHVDGCFSECVLEMRVMLAGGEIQTCKRDDELFLATCGGMGLTGIILDAKIALKKINSKNINQITIKTKNLREVFEAFEEYAHLPYSAGWVDALAKKDSIGKGIIVLGDFANDGDLGYKEKNGFNVLFNFPSFVLNNLIVKMANWLFYEKESYGISKKTVDMEAFFYPLDAIHHWNRFYGKGGFTQYQFILPKETGYEGIQEVLKVISQGRIGSFLTVLKLHGKANANYLSFPMEGYSLALDFKIERGLFELLDRLDEIVLKYGGRIYLTKDVRVSKETFEKGYPLIEKFREFRRKSGADKKFHSLQSKRVGI